MARLSSFSAVVALLATPTAAQDSADAGQFMNEYMWHSKNVPGSAKCGVDCTGLCAGGMDTDIKKTMFSSMADGIPFANSNQYCTEACVAHSIETSMEGYKGWSSGLNGQKQGMYVQKVMAEYCSRGLCKHGQSLQQKQATIQKHENQEAEFWGYPAEPSGWPSTCATPSYYCTQFCENVYHDPTEPLGEHPGADSEWSKNREQCNKNCNKNWNVVKTVYDTQCTCLKEHGTPVYPSHLQEARQVEEVDVGAFMQVPQEL